MKIYCVRFTDGKDYFSTPTLFTKLTVAQLYVEKENNNPRNEGLHCFLYEDWAFEESWW